MASIVEKYSSLCFDEGHRYADEASVKVKERSQFLTPTNVVMEILANMPEDMWQDGKTFIDPECGIGQMIIPVAIIKKELGHNNVLSTIYGVELNKSNVDLCRSRLLDIFGHNDPNIKQVEKNIVCANSLEYNFKFNKE